jgi:hypothetical protein
MADDSGWKAETARNLKWILLFAVVLLSAKKLLDIGIIDLLTNDAVKIIHAIKGR